MVTATIPVDEKRRTRWEAPYLLRLLFTDIAVVAVAVFLAQYIKFGTGLSESEAAKRLTGFSILFALLWLTALAMFRTRSHRVIGGGIDEYRHVLNASFWTFGVIAIASLLLKLEVARGYLAVALPVGTVGLLLGRHFWSMQIARERAQGRCQTLVLAIGDRRAVSVLARELMRKQAHGYRIVGVGVPGYGERRGEAIVVNDVEIPILGDEFAALAAIKECGANTVAVTGGEHFGCRWDPRTGMATGGDGCRSGCLSPGVVDIAGQRLTMRPVSGYALIHVEGRIRRCQPIPKASLRLLFRTGRTHRGLADLHLRSDSDKAYQPRADVLRRGTNRARR